MGQIVVTEFISLDGVVEAPGGGEGFKHDGWSFEFDRGDEGNKFKLDETRASAALLLGRRTYEGFAEAWPSRTDDVGFADKFNSMPKYVVSTTLESADWNNTTILRSLDDVPKLKDDVEGELVVHGSPTLVQGLLEQDLVDELRLMVFPVVLGTGKRLWGETSDKKPFTLADAKTVGDGIAILTFRR
jgi:dihydrofolate reductase